MDIRALRQATASDHEAVEDALPLMNADLSLKSYRAILEKLCGLVSGWEELALRVAPPELQPFVKERARLALLERDLLFLQGTCGEQWCGGEDAMWPFPRLIGAMYVMEGSRLGGRLIAQHVRRQFGFNEGEGAAYFEGFGSGTKQMWGQFRVVVEQLPPEDEEAVIAAAKDMFKAFSDWMSDGNGPPSRSQDLVTMHRKGGS